MRERRLAGDVRAGDRVRAEARRMQWQFVRRSWAWLGSGVLIAAAGTAGLLLLFHDPFQRGLVLGAAVVLTFGGLWTLVVQLTGTGPLSMGAQAEVWTASEIRPLRKHGWKVANHVALRPWDIDHVLVGPGGVVAVETKWSSDGWTLAPPEERLRRAIQQARRNAHDLRVWRPQLRATPPETVRPVVFLWGGTRTGQEKPADVVQIDGVSVVYGIDAARRWRSMELAVQHPRLTEEQIGEIWGAVRQQVDKADARELATSPRPPTVTQIYFVIVATFCAGLAAVLASSYAYLHTRSVWAWAASVAALAAVGVIARRWKWLRFPAVSWLAGLGFTIVGALVLTLGPQAVRVR